MIAVALAGCARRGDLQTTADTATTDEVPTTSTGTAPSETGTGEVDEVCPRLDRVVHLSSTLREGVDQVVVHPDGDLVVAGSFGSTLDLGSGQVGVGCGPQDAFVAKLSPDLATVRWAHVVGGCDLDHGFGVGVGADGSVVLVGRTGWSFVAVDGVELLPDKHNFTSYGGFAAVFDGAGTFRWLRTVGQQAGDFLTSVAVGPDGTVYATGEFESETVTSGPFTVARSPGEDPRDTQRSDGLVAAWTADGTPRWLLALGGVSEDHGYSILWHQGRPQVLAALDGVASWWTPDASGPLPATDPESFVLGLGPTTGTPVTALPVAPFRTTIYELEPWTEGTLGVGSLQVDRDSDCTTVDPGAPPSDPWASLAGWVTGAGEDPSLRVAHCAPEDSSPYAVGGGRGIGAGVSGDRIAVTGSATGDVVWGYGSRRAVSHTSQTSGHDAFAATFRHDGEFRCVWLFDAGNLVDAEDAVVLDDGSVVVVGQFEDAVDLLDAEGGVATHLTAAGDTYDGFIVRYAPASEP